MTAVLATLLVLTCTGAAPATQPTLRLIARPDAPPGAQVWLDALPGLRARAEKELEERIALAVVDPKARAAATRQLEELRRPVPVLPAPPVTDPQVGAYGTVGHGPFGSTVKLDVVRVLGPHEVLVHVPRPDYTYIGESVTTRTLEPAAVLVRGIETSNMVEKAKVELGRPLLFSGTAQHEGETVFVAEAVNPSWFYVEEVLGGRTTTRPYKPG